MWKRIAVLGGLLLACGSLDAQIRPGDDPLRGTRWGASLGYNRTPVLGIALTGFASQELGRAGLPLRGTVALDVLFSEDGDSPYYRTSAYTGVEGCHDARSGLRVDEGECVPALGLAGRAELMGRVGSHWGLGAGARVAGIEGLTPYGLVRYETPFRRHHWFAQLSAGDQYTQVDAGIAVRF
jgi:hypothetical protein